jgi:uncharacterized membrane protein (UPF0127 family)
LTNYRKRCLRVALFALSLLMAVCLSCRAQAGQPQTGLEKRTFRIGTGAGPVSIACELAKTDKQKEIGLMFRKNMPEGTGMLFIYQRDEVMNYWMKNTLVPLSIAFIASDGRIVAIDSMQPKSLSTVSSDRSVRYALEVPQGWFKKAGVKVGDTLEIPDEI